MNHELNHELNHEPVCVCTHVSGPNHLNLSGIIPSVGQGLNWFSVAHILSTKVVDYCRIPFLRVSGSHSIALGDRVCPPFSLKQ